MLCQQHHLQTKYKKDIQGLERADLLFEHVLSSLHKKKHSSTAALLWHQDETESVTKFPTSRFSTHINNKPPDWLKPQNAFAPSTQEVSEFWTHACLVCPEKYAT